MTISLFGCRFFTLEDFARFSKLVLPSAKVSLHRKTKTGAIVRIRKNLYAFSETLKGMKTEDWFQLANLIQTPSYVSFLSALSYYEWTTQMTLSRIESCNPVRSRVFEVMGYEFAYYYCRKEFYFGFQRRNGVFIAEPEKALLDSVYLLSLGRYALDISALNLKDCDWRKIEKWRKVYSSRLRRFFENWREEYERIH